MPDYTNPIFQQGASTGQALITTPGWPIEPCVGWPPYLCSNCWGMKFFYNTRMAQCTYCSHIILHWGCDDNPRGVASNP